MPVGVCVCVCVCVCVFARTRVQVKYLSADNLIYVSFLDEVTGVR